MTQMIYPTTDPAFTEQLVIERGEGVYVYDDTGKQYLEGLSGLWCTSLGYGNEELVETAAAQMRKLTYSHLFGGKTHPAAMQLADELAAMVPMADARVFLGSSGSDANDTLVKLLRYYFSAIGQPGRYKIIARDRAYHGVTVAAASLTGLPANHAHFGLPAEALGVLRTGSAHFYRDGLPGESEEAFSRRRADELEALIQAQGADSIAAFIAEPVSGAGGVIVPPAGYYNEIRAVLDRHGILFWDDEVICGFGRLGSDFGATALDLQPSMMALAKGLSSAYMPISAALIDGQMYEPVAQLGAEMGVFGHGYTYSGHPVACAVASKVLEIYRRDDIFAHAAAMGRYLQDSLQPLCEHPLVGEVRGMGMIAALELVACKETRRPFAGNSVGAFCQRACQDAGLIVRALGGNSIALCPPLIITRPQVDELVDKLAAGLDQTLAHVKRENLLSD
ncbi:MAG: aspartate aminotransferase family protein [Halioglobus sp.]|nr:aspartate aminotransferase family protein [Halioglobus sp.]|tara:strand:- start:1565 stop:2914 length:1350 start_codon:yes stop_codon:yes gene_type:complete